MGSTDISQDPYSIAGDNRDRFKIKMNATIKKDKQLLPMRSIYDDYQKQDQVIEESLNQYNEKIDEIQDNKCWNRVNHYSRKALIEDILRREKKRKYILK